MLPSKLYHQDRALAGEEVAKLLTDQTWARLSAGVKIYPCHTNRASEAGHPCDAYLFHTRENWQQREPYGLTTQSIFNEGNLHEANLIQEIMKDCAELGWGFVGQQQDFQDKDLQLTGHVDGVIIIRDLESGTQSFYPTEVKSMSERAWALINTSEDFRDAKWPYLRKYYGQMQAYLYLNASECGIFVLKNKTNGLRKYIHCLLDFDFADAMIKRLIRVNDVIANNGQPEKILEDFYCDQCAFRKICIGEKEGSVEPYDSEVLADALQARDENKEAADRYEEACEIVKAECAKVDPEKTEFRVSDWIVKRTLIPEAVVKKSEGIRKAYWRNKFVKLLK